MHSVMLPSGNYTDLQPQYIRVLHQSMTNALAVNADLQSHFCHFQALIHCL